jgi:hypothetical protein
MSFTGKLIQESRQEEERERRVENVKILGRLFTLRTIQKPIELEDGPCIENLGLMNEIE